MRELFMIIALIVFALCLRAGCERSRTQGSIAKDCQLVCDDVGFDFDYAVKTGLFSYECKCKKKPTLPMDLKQR